MHTERTSTSTFFFVGGGDTTGPQKIESPGKASEIPGMHGKSWETRKNPGKFISHKGTIKMRKNGTCLVFDPLLAVDAKNMRFM